MPLFEELRRRYETLPGVESVALAGQLPVRGFGGSSTLVIDGYTPPTGTDSVEVLRASAGPGYFETLEIRLLHGRTFAPEDTPDSSSVAVISEAMARAYWGRSDAVGERFRWQGRT